MDDLELFLYAYNYQEKDGELYEDSILSDDLTYEILCEYIRKNNVNFSSAKTERIFISKAKDLAKKLKKYIVGEGITAHLQNMPIAILELTVEVKCGPEIKSWPIWKKK